MYILRLYKGYATTIKLNNTKRRAYTHEPPVSPKNGTRQLYNAVYAGSCNLYAAEKNCKYVGHDKEKKRINAE